MISKSKNVYIDKLDNIINKYNNIYHKTITMNPVDIKNDTYIESYKIVNDIDLRFKVGDNVRT